MMIMIPNSFISQSLPQIRLLRAVTYLDIYLGDSGIPSAERGRHYTFCFPRCCTSRVSGIFDQQLLASILPHWCIPGRMEVALVSACHMDKGDGVV